MKNLLLSCSALLFCFLISAQESDTLKWTPEKHMEIRQISGAATSHDGKYVAYVVREPLMEGEKSEYLSQIWVAATEGSLNVQYTRGEKSSHSPAFSPDGKSIAFLSERSDKTQLFIMRLMGGEAEQITEEKDGIGSFQWAPDNKRIAFLKKDEKSEEEEKEIKEKRDVIEVDQNFKFSHLYTVDLGDDEHKVQRLTSGDFDVTSFDWSPDGKKIVFAHKPDPRINTSRLESDIAWVASDSSEINIVVDRKGPDTAPRFSPDGKQIAFQSTGGGPQPIGLSDIYITSLSNGVIQPLQHTSNRQTSILGWSIDSKNLYVSDVAGMSRAAMRISANPKSKEPVAILTSSDGTAGSMSKSSGSEKLAFVYQTTDQPAELFVCEGSGKNLKKLSEVNSKVVLPEMGKTEVVKWKSKDGLEIEGLLTYPVGYKKGDKVPLALQIHGGPAGVFTKSFTGNPSIYMTQYFAEKGIAVLRPNPRGSTGYGKDFRYANFKDWGFGDYEDVMSGVDKVIEMGVGDPERMTVMGWSYGGYLTSFLVTRTNRFKAASMGAGLPNLISMTTTTDIPDYIVGHMGSEVWDDYDTYEKHSAMYRIKNVTTPTQVIHGANDLRVPFTQGQEFYVALQRRGIPTEMLVLPRTPHGPREPKLLMEVSPRIMSWFSNYITGRS